MPSVTSEFAPAAGTKSLVAVFSVYAVHGVIGVGPARIGCTRTLEDAGTPVSGTSRSMTRPIDRSSFGYWPRLATALWKSTSGSVCTDWGTVLPPFFLSPFG